MEKTRREENTEATRRALLDAATELFTARGFSETPTEEIVKRARVSRGALYHHFTDKRDLFRAVLEEVNVGATSAIAERGLSGEDVWAGVIEGVNAFLDVCHDPAYRQVVLLDGPAVLGWREWRDIGEKHGLGLVRAMVEAAAEKGVIDPQPAEPLASMIHAALNEAGMHIANASDPKKARQRVSESLFTLLDGLRRRPG